MKSSIQMLLMALIFLSACATYDLTKLPTSDVNEIYQNSLADAVYPTVSKVDNNLFAINKNNNDLTWKTIDGEEYVLVVSWKGEKKWYEPPYVKDNIYPTGSSHPVWVTASPQLLKWAKSETRLMKWVEDGEIDKVNSRLKQLLGLPPNPAYTYNYFVEFWVKPADLFRPCPDPEIDDSSCEACNPKIDSTFQAWINDTRAARYYNTCELLDRYPWTALGYTYDWSPTNKTHQGMSEYVIHNDKNVIVNKIYTTEEYLKQ